MVAGLEEDGFYESSLEKTSRASGKRELLSGQNNCISMQCCLQIIQESRPNSEPLTNDIPFLKHQTTLQRFDYWTGRHWSTTKSWAISTDVYTLAKTYVYRETGSYRTDTYYLCSEAHVTSTHGYYGEINRLSDLNFTHLFSFCQIIFYLRFKVLSVLHVI